MSQELLQGISAPEVSPRLRVYLTPKQPRKYSGYNVNLAGIHFIRKLAMSSLANFKTFLAQVSMELNYFPCPLMSHYRWRNFKPLNLKCSTSECSLICTTASSFHQTMSYE